MVWKDELPALTYQDLEVKPASAYTRTDGRTDESPTWRASLPNGNSGAPRSTGEARCASRDVPRGNRWDHSDAEKVVGVSRTYRLRSWLFFVFFFARALSLP